MGHETLLKSFGGPQNIFLFFFQFQSLVNSFESLGGFEQFVQACHQEDLGKIRHVKQQIKSFELCDNKW